MPKKAAKRKLDVAQRTLFQFSAFKQSKSVASSRPKAPDSHRAKRRKSDSTTPYSGSSRLYQEQEATNRVRETPKQSQSLLQTPSMQVPVEFRSIAQVELRKSLQTLNREQKAAVDAPWRSPIAVFAGAGTGKTTALIARIWNMVTQGITPESILAITFTRKACQEIKDRLSVDKLGCKVPVNVFTFHGWAIRFLRMKRIREMAGVPKTLVIWAPRDQKEHMAQACQRARVDHELLPQARRVMGLPVTGQTSPDESWKELLCKAFTDPAIRNSVLCARERAKDRVKAALKEVASPEKDADQEDGELETKDASAEYARQHAGTANAYPVEKTSTSIVQQYGSLSGPAAAPGASTKPSAKLRHIHTTPKVLAAVDGGLSDSDAEEADIGNEHLKSSHRSGCGHWVEILFPDGSIDTWTLVAKELLTTYCRQECGIEIIVSKQGSSSGVGKAARDRIIHHRKHFLFHKAPADGAPAHATKLDPAAIKAKASALVQFRDWIRKNNAEGLEPETFQTVANKYYDARMKLLGALDFDEMLALVEHLLDTNVEACGIARTMYQHLLVDEFQDSNAVQIRIVKHLQDGRGHLTVVGDDAQSIYGFRGATNRAFLLLSDMLEDCSLQEYSMTQNYRSLAPIIEVGNCVLKNLMSCGALVQKDLTCTRTGHANPVSYHVLGTGLDEARFIVSEIKQLHDEHRYKYDDMAIICRLNNNRSLFAHEFGVLHHIKMQLAKDAIPHRVFRGRQMTEKPEYVLTVDVLKFLTNPLNDGALLAILESKLSMKAGIGESVVTQLKQIVRDSNQPVPVWNSLQDLVRRHDTATRKRNAVKRLLEWYSRVYGQVMFMSLPEAMLYIWTESGISALAGKNRKKSGASPAEDNAPTSVVSDHSHQPDISFSRQDTAQMSQHSGLSAADVLRTPAKKHKTQKSPAPDATINILTSPTLEALHKNSQEFLAEWTADSLFLERFGELRLAPSAMGSTREPSSLLSLATAAVMQLPQTQRVNAVNILATANPGLADLILSVNKCGYGPVADFLQHLDLNSSSVPEEDDSDAHADDGKVTLSTVHGCKGLEWPVVFVPKFIDNVMPLKFYPKRAIPVDSNEEAGCEDMAIAAVQADARIRGTLLKTHDDVVAYLPEWLKQDGLELEVEDDMNSGSESRDDLRPHFLHNDPEQVSRCYKRKKEKQHDEEEIRLAHVAFTRAKDRLYVTSHRIAEGSADASSLEAAIASDTRAVKRVDPSKFIPLLDSSEAMTRTCHPIDAVEEYLGRCATQNDMRQGIRHLGNAWQTQQAIGLVAGAEGAASQGAVHPVSAAVAAAEAVVQDASAHAASAFHFMGAAKHELQPSNNSVSKFPDCAPALHVAPGGSSSGHANPESQLRAGGIHSRPFGRRVPPMQTGQSFGLSYSDDEPPLPMRRCIAMNASADASTSRPLQTMGSTSKASTPSRHGAGSSHGVIRSGSPAALRGLPPAAVAGHNGESRRVSVERVSGQQGYARPGASAGHDLLIDLTSPRAVGRDSTSQAANSTGKGVADHMHASKAASMTKKLPRVHAGYKSQAKSVHFRAPRRNT